MLLKLYLRANKLTPAEFGRLVNATPAVVRTWLLNGKIPSRRYMNEIFRVTKGEVDSRDFYNQRKPAPRPLDHSTLA